LVKGWPPLRKALVAAILLVLTSFGIWQAFSGSSLSETDASDEVDVLVASRYIPPFQPIQRGWVTTKTYPKNLLLPGVFHTASELVGRQNMPLFAAAVGLPESYPLSRTVTIDLTKSHGLAATLPMGNVAVSFSVDPVRGVGGWVRPGDTIAVFRVTENLDAHHFMHKSAEMLFPSLSVLAVDARRLGTPGSEAADGGNSANNGEDSASGMSVITVSVNPAEASALTQAREQGHLCVVLRAPGDHLLWDQADR
jgi:Flp pilus assembly protein CpaB